ncbi:MerR family transcriptional regulator [Virgisporangium ochraceum]|jgi:DNA-binding transcriptional MerR regulator|uniref:Transcriptional regulator n=1 Tax=Virgisporangium ochraceum TaxID=65505 RepID=A0A8J4EEK7_9ACTN|nr:MerR family transcriptional regulator [Virgisporangium ochraceum]GIJ71874.1 transcriptional regulator [Virgisporangium ochraceum]
MRIAELSDRSGVAVPTIKYYLREGLLPAGEAVRANQARYDERHLQRLRLIRVLIDVGRLPVATIRDLVNDLDQPDPDLHHALGRALQSAPPNAPEPAAAPEVSAAEAEVEALLGRHGWQVSEGAPARRRVAEVIAALRRLGNTEMVDVIDRYAKAAEDVAAVDLGLVRAAEPEMVLYRAVVGTILGDALIAGLRRLAQESLSAEIFHDRKDSSD